MSEIIRAWLLQPVLSLLRSIERKIAMNQQELIAALAAASAETEAQTALVTKISGETTALLAAVDALQAAIDAGTVSPEVEAALADVASKRASLTAALQGVDAQVPDQTPAP